MSGIASSLAAAVLAALAVKLMDDALDEARDRAAGRRNWAVSLRGGACSYGLALFALSAALDGRLAAAILLAAFACGMGWDGARLPLGLRGWQEGALGLALALWLCGPELIAAALLAALAASAADALIDGHARWGKVETSLGGVAAALGVAALQPLLLAAVGTGLAISLVTRRA